VKRFAGFAMAACLVVVGATGTVASASAPDVVRAKVKIVNFAFQPTPLAIKKGTIVIFKNTTTTTSHTSTSDTGLWDSGIIPPGGKFKHRFRKVGTFTYHCSIHPSMMGEIDVSA